MDDHIPSPEAAAQEILAPYGSTPPIPIDDILRDYGVRLGRAYDPDDRTKAIVGTR